MSLPMWWPIPPFLQCPFSQNFKQINRLPGMISLIDENMCLICSTRALACAPQLIYHIEHLSKCSGCKVLPNVPATTGCRKIMQLHPQVYNLSRVPSEHISMWTFHVSRTFTLIGKSKAAEWNRDIINFSTTKSKKKLCNDPQHVSLIVLVGFIWTTAYSSCWQNFPVLHRLKSWHCTALNFSQLYVTATELWRAFTRLCPLFQ